MEETEEEQKERYEIVEVPTGTKNVIRDNEKKIDYSADDMKILLEILRELNEIKKAVA